MAQTNSNKRAETELVLAASIRRLLDKTVRAACPPHPLQGVARQCRNAQLPLQRGRSTQALHVIVDMVPPQTPAAKPTLAAFHATWRHSAEDAVTTSTSHRRASTPRRSMRSSPRAARSTRRPR